VLDVQPPAVGILIAPNPRSIRRLTASFKRDAKKVWHALVRLEEILFDSEKTLSSVQPGKKMNVLLSSVTTAKHVLKTSRQTVACSYELCIAGYVSGDSREETCRTEMYESIVATSTAVEAAIECISLYVAFKACLRTTRIKLPMTSAMHSINAAKAAMLRRVLTGPEKTIEKEPEKTIEKKKDVVFGPLTKSNTSLAKACAACVAFDVNIMRNRSNSPRSKEDINDKKESKHVNKKRKF